MNSCREKLVPMGDPVFVRERPNGAILRARQAAEYMSGPLGMGVYIGDWVVEQADPDEQDTDLFVVRQAEFERAWVVVKGAVPC